MSRHTLETFYGAFQKLDGQAMQACYADTASFEDEAFKLQGREEIGAMWRMLCDTTRTKAPDDWHLDFTVLDDTHVDWEAHYRFTATDRLVVNHIEARFTFNEAGQILHHRDRFDFWAWSRQALGLPGLLLGWSPMLRAKVQAQAAKNLAAYRAKNPR